MLLTQAQIDYQAHRANWYVQVDYRDVNVPGDVSIMTGDGVDDLDRLLAVMPVYPRGMFLIDVGAETEQFVPCDISDIQAIKTAYIAKYGNVNKPEYPVEYPDALEIANSAGIFEIVDVPLDVPPDVVPPPDAP